MTFAREYDRLDENITELRVFNKGDCPEIAAQLKAIEDAAVANAQRLAILDEAWETWGQEHQTLIALEEMAELAKALLKYKRDPTLERFKHIAEEMADVRIMLDQLDNMFAPQVIAQAEREKLAKLEAHLNTVDACVKGVYSRSYLKEEERAAYERGGGHCKLYLSVYGPAVTRQVFDFIKEGRGAPDAEDFDRFHEEADCIAHEMVLAERRTRSFPPVAEPEES